MNIRTFMEEWFSEFHPRPGSFLEIGVTDGLFLEKLVNKFNAYGLGIGPKAVNRDSDRLEIMKLDPEEVIALGRWFDVIFSLNAISQVGKSKKDLQALLSVTGWGGRVILVDKLPDTNANREGPEVKGMGPDQLMANAKNIGLEIRKNKILKGYFSLELIPTRWKLAAAVEEDERTICPKMFGMAPKFAVYTFSPNEGFCLLEIRINPFEKTLQRGKTFDVYELVEDCQALLAGLIGKKGIPRLQMMGVHLFFAKGTVEANLSACGFELW